MSRPNSFWKTLPLGSFLLFLLGVFFIFITIAFASDITELGGQPPLRLVLGILITGVFPVGYAVAGFALRKQVCKAMVPLFVVHFLFINVLVRTFPALPQPARSDGANLLRL